MYKKRLGLSIYPEIVGPEETIKYLEEAKTFGFSVIFANLLETQNNDEGKKKLEMLASVYKKAKEMGYEVIVDVNPQFYKEFKLPDDEIEFFYNIGVTGIRLDMDFQGKVESKITQNKRNMVLSLNASSGYDTFQKTIELGGIAKNIVVCHNFYPMRFTGLDYDRFIELSGVYRAYGARVQAFVTLAQEQKGIGPWNVNQGMPTIERHRFMTLEEQVHDLLKIGLIDDILISQHRATTEQLKGMSKILKQYEEFISEEIHTYKVELNKDVQKIEKGIVDLSLEPSDEMKKVWGMPDTHGNRPDYNGFFIRSTMPRLWYKDKIVNPFNSGKKMKKGDVVVLNKNLGRYNAELIIVTNEFDDKDDNGRNVIGRVVDEDMWKLDFSKGAFRFKLEEKK